MDRRNRELNTFLKGINDPSRARTTGPFVLGARVVPLATAIGRIEMTK